MDNNLCRINATIVCHCLQNPKYVIQCMREVIECRWHVVHKSQYYDTEEFEDEKGFANFVNDALLSNVGHCRAGSKYAYPGVVCCG